MMSNGLKPSAARRTPTISERTTSRIRTSAGFPPKKRSICQLSLFAGQAPQELRLIGAELVKQAARSSGTDAASESLIVEPPPVPPLPEPFAGWFARVAGARMRTNCSCSSTPTTAATRC